MRLHSVFAILSLTAAGHAEFRVQELYSDSEALEDGASVNTTRVPGLVLDDLLERSLEPRACYAPYTECQHTGRCCAPPADACCPDGSCVTSTDYVCCGSSHICYTGDLCCHDGCIKPGVKCCTAGHICATNQECCEDRCMAAGRQCCLGGQSCPGGHTCVLYNGEVRCCPPGGCYSYTDYFYWYYYVYWYIEVYWEIRVEVVTSTLELTSSSVRTSTSLSLQASDSNALSSIYASVTSSILAAASQTPDLDSLPTSTTTTVSSTSTTTTTRSTTTTTTTTRPTDGPPSEEETLPSFPETSSDSPDPDFFPTASGTEPPPVETVQAGDEGAGASIAPPVFTALTLVSFIFMIVL
ncbi:hypothetical protein BJX63DRAFT_433896 [Aspergillus granulosus]|uniref:GPI anchored protein n=1 Tax=Aspergillus granulosus TaxID=176169 RepID=A0ABR4H5T4_9EURO